MTNAEIFIMIFGIVCWLGGGIVTASFILEDLKDGKK